MKYVNLGGHAIGIQHIVSVGPIERRKSAGSLFSRGKEEIYFNVTTVDGRIFQMDRPLSQEDIRILSEIRNIHVKYLLGDLEDFQGVFTANTKGTDQQQQ
jgi:hypothetical protein